ncbi:MAG: hypothetical protein J0M02_16265 [Planctomycetes bacterium]|nr:hypothetical protein [Planctomycetota bacterium]
MRDICHALRPLLVLAVLLAGCGVPPAAPRAEPRVQVLHVRADASGAGADGAAPDTAFPTIQAAFDRVRPGGTVVIHPGVYHEVPVLRTLGTASAPVTIRADAIARDRVILTAADRALREGRIAWRLEDEALGLYSAPFGHQPARLLYSGTDLLPFPTLDGLRTFTLLDDYPGPQHGFFYQAETARLFVRLHAGGRYGDRDPARHRMCAAPATAQGFAGNWIYQTEHANLLIDAKGEGHVRISGITFETPGAAGVVSKAGSVTVADCWFRGCRFGVFGAGLPGNLAVEHCDYHQYPAFDDMAEVIALHPGRERAAKDPIYWWHRKGVKHSPEAMKTYETGIAGGIGAGWRISGNHIHDAFEGLSTWGISDAVDLDVSGNRFERLVDNAVETENHARDVRIHDNDIIDVFEPISWQPLAGLPWPGPVQVFRNRFITTPAASALWPWPVGCFKLGASDRNWEGRPEMAAVPRDEVAPPGSGFQVYDNAIIYPHGYLLALPMPAARALANFAFRGNAVAVRGLAERPAFTGSRIAFTGNRVVAPGDAARAPLIAGAGGAVLPRIEDLGQLPPAAGEVGPRERQ